LVQLLESGENFDVEYAGKVYNNPELHVKTVSMGREDIIQFPM
jgi:hypothetical protein